MKRKLTNILVTGGAGFIGSNFIRTMLKKTPEFTGRIINLDALTYAGNLHTLESLLSKENFRFVKADITDRKAIFSLCEEEKFDAVVNSHNIYKMAL